MIRLIFTMCFWVVVARWIYAETYVRFPTALPAIDYALDTVRIPTSDQWDLSQVEQVVGKIAEVHATQQSAAPFLASAARKTDRHGKLLTAQGRYYPYREPGFEKF